MRTCDLWPVAQAVELNALKQQQLFVSLQEVGVLGQKWVQLTRLSTARRTKACPVGVVTTSTLPGVFQRVQRRRSHAGTTLGAQPRQVQHPQTGLYKISSSPLLSMHLTRQAGW